MSSPGSPPRPRGSGPRRRAAQVNPDLRISDAERAEVADRLSKHYGDGRLDQAEFDERLDQAMKAKTHSDLTGLFADLPGADSSQAPARWRRARPRRRIPFLALVIVITVAVAIAGQALMRSFIPWLLIGLLAFLWLRHGPWRNRSPQ